jgi:hypothetical protein
MFPRVTGVFAFGASPVLPQRVELPTIRITKKAVDEIQPTGVEYTVWDKDLTGFGLRVRANGAMSFVVVYRAGNGRKAAVRNSPSGRWDGSRPTRRGVSPRRRWGGCQRA